MEKPVIKGRGAQLNLPNTFSKQHYSVEDSTTGNKEISTSPTTQFFYENPVKIVSVSESPDLGVMHSINPYQGCEHGCAYCYARNSHNYWGFNSGLEFESKIIVKRTAPQMLERYLSGYQGQVTPILLSGNTDCYQPAERTFQLTRKMLEIFYKFRHPVSIITKNHLILRDLDILSKLAGEKLVNVFVSITTLNETIRRKMEPRTASVKKRLEVVETLTQNSIPVGVMNAPIIPGLTDHEIPMILKETAARGALTAGYALVRLNGNIGTIFEDWINKSFPTKASKVLNQIAACHDGKLNDSQWHRRQKGSGNIADMISQVFKTSRTKYFDGRKMPVQHKHKFRRGGNHVLSFDL
ncbi:MAG: radical SAM protein [Cyclobacteriaceae bacterium]|nr:MAG: radical SAM protein [Cyclobacteriaceae bacterium]